MDDTAPPAEQLISVDAFFAGIDMEIPDTAEYRRLSGVILDHPLVSQMQALDPFSDAYRDLAMRIYFDIRGGEHADFRPERDEKSGGGDIANVFSEVSPWSFRDTGFIAEMLFSWGHILRLLDMNGATGNRVLEYGPGSGQILLTLARSGCEAYAVDIDAASLESVATQARLMDLTVHTERAVFGEGFEGQRFDAIIFFEAFHHAADFQALSQRLQERLEPGGRVIFCGEPIVPQAAGSVPYPWGPRLDGLSSFCIRRFGWMELGFTRAFFMEMLRANGWRAEHHPFPACPRAEAFVARIMTSEEQRGQFEIDLRREAPGVYLAPEEWNHSEGTHRWTIAHGATVPLLKPRDAVVDLTLTVANYLPVDKQVRIACGDVSADTVLHPGETRDIELAGCTADRLVVEADLHLVSEVIPGSGDMRRLGISVQQLVSVPSDAK
ncbi:methyltransferase domain-containing protein [Aurantimonas aggregata]|uniref:Methyltransferase domain-containing protein n=1 Tax=Aurantimonas aggregata TaxID=2047720 RepID=A0A6L9MJW8_9HYPH|nr:class I SAM-dependent methyltransferase [Aurantimonas aggregata]NDV87922.1 methyltransferase domain-containing protein [Aurantimonas aggregata]